ncbi:MAG: CHASE2 domain-containing protein [Myxococcota bacterium]
MKQRSPGILLGLGAILCCLGLRSWGWLEAAELSVYDRLIRSGMGEAEGASPVFLISIGEQEFQRYGYPIPDRILAEALDALGEAGTSAIGIDLYRDGPASGTAADLAGWVELERAITANPRIVLSELLPSTEEPGTPPPEFARESQIGFNNLLMDSGRVVRRGYLFAWDDETGKAHQSLSLRLALLHLSGKGLGLGPDPENPDGMRMGPAPVSPLEEGYGAYSQLDAGGYQFALDYARDDASFAVIPFMDVVEGVFDRARLSGQIALIGTDSPSVKDDFNSPPSAGEIVKGYRLHAQIADQLIRMAETGQSPRGAWSDWAEMGWVVGWGLAGVALSANIATLGWAVPSFVAGLGLLAGIAFLLFMNGSFLAPVGTWIPSVAPALSWLSAGGLMLGDRARREARSQRQLMQMFRQYNTRSVADQLWKQRDEFMEGGRPKPQRVTITALLSDLKGYTAASEKMEPDALMAWIDSYMNAMTRVIEEHGGHVDDFIGDGIKANFGVPIPSETEAEVSRDACQAVRCAMAMGEMLAELNDEWRSQGWPTGRQRIGLYTGTAVVGSIGNEERLKYTSVGDTINTAARLESIGGPLDFDKEQSLQRIFIGEPTRNAVGERFELAPEGAHAVKGKVEKLEIYRVLGERPEYAEEDGK